MAVIESKYYRYLSQLFSRNTLISICGGKIGQALINVLKVSGYHEKISNSITVGELYDDLYSFLFENYRCEYIYKNLLANEILEQYHSERSSILTEFRVNNCLADFVILNGTSCVYEIKTELDTFDRLDRQLNAYRKTFDKIYVVTHYSHLNRLISKVDNSIGIICMDEEQVLRKKREAISNKTNVDPGVIFDSLRLKEFSELLINQVGYVPSVPNTQRYSVCRELTQQIEPSIVHDEMVKILKKRLSPINIEFAINNIPRSLKLLYLESKFNAKQNDILLSQLKEPIYF